MTQSSTTETTATDDDDNTNKESRLKPETTLPSSSTSVNIDTTECRICRDNDTSSPLLIVCKCTTRVHVHCLRRWVGYRADAMFPLLASESYTTCEVCRHPINPNFVNNIYNYTSSSSSTAISGNCLIGRKLLAHGERLCEYLVSVEGCLLIFLFVLAVMGHLLFVLGIYNGTNPDQYVVERMVLGIANALLTLSLLVLVQKIVSRWLRESDLLLAVASAPLHSNDLEAQAYTVTGITPTVTLTTNEGTSRRVLTNTTHGRCSFLGQVLLGAILSILAAAELFFLMRQLPFGTLA